MDFLSILLILIIILLISNCKKDGLLSKEWELKSEKQIKKENEIAKNNANDLNSLVKEKDNTNNQNNSFKNISISCNNRILGPVNDFHQKFKSVDKEFGFRHWWKKNKTRNYVPKDYNFEGTSVRQYLDNLDNVNNVYCY